jgi:hypothetical protein
MKIENTAFDCYEKAAEFANSFSGSGYEAHIWRNTFAKKFAELIIKDCCEVLEPYDHKSVEILKTYYGTEDA